MRAPTNTAYHKEQKKFMNRYKAREAAFTLIYQHTFAPSNSLLDMYFDEIEERDDLEEDEFIRAILSAFEMNSLDIDELIAARASGWKLDRLARVTLALLRLGVCEMKYCDTPKEIAINEIVELAKTYDSDEAPAFINGILDAIAKEQ